MPTLYLIRGIPGSGKSTLARTMRDFGMVRECLEADYYFTDDNGNYEFRADRLQQAHEWCQGMCRIFLDHDHNVAVSNTSTTEKEVETYRKIAEDCGAAFVSVVVENRHEGKNVHNVPDEKIRQMQTRFSVKL